jgi:hypothetical protein
MTELAQSEEVELPATTADLKEWARWVDSRLPYRGTKCTGPYELRHLMTVRDRELAALSARLWFRIYARDKTGRMEPLRVALYGEALDL